MELENVEDVYPLSTTQSGMLFHTINSPQSGTYVGQIQLLLAGQLNLEVLQAAWWEILRRHPVLRTAFLWDGLDEPLQVVRQQTELAWELVDWSDESEAECAAKLERRLRAERLLGFDLSEAPLLRMLLVKVDSMRHRLVWTCHHILLDGWSAAIVLDEVLRLYTAGVEGKELSLPPPYSFRDHIARLRALDPEEAAPFWREYLESFKSRTSLRAPSAPNGEESQNLHRQVKVCFPASTTVSLLETGRRLRITLNTLVHGAWGLTLQRYSGENDVVFGTTLSGRPAEIPGADQCVGLFINTLPVRVTMDHEPVLRDWLIALQKNLLRIREHELSSLLRVQQWSEVPRGEALFDTIVVMESFPHNEAEDQDFAGLRILERESRDQSNYPLAVLVEPGEELHVVLVYNPSRYTDEFATQLLRHLQNVLTAIPAYLERPVLDLPVLSVQEEQRLLVEWNGTATELPSGISVMDLIAERAKNTPQAVALACGGDQVSYDELARQSDNLARHLVSTGVNPGDPVAICLDRSAELVIGILAILKAAGVYVPLDPNYPKERLAYMVRDSGAKSLLTSGELALVVGDLGPKPTLIDEITLPEGIENELPRLPDSVAGENAYLIYTSGSTGNPKGVLVAHSNLLSSTLARHDYYSDQPDVYLLLSSVAFDSSVAGIFWALTSGACLVISEHRMEQDIGRLAACIAQHGVTHTLCLPSLYSVLLGEAESGELNSLRTVIVAGEAFPPALLQRHRDRLPAVALYNEYGPTEATVWCSAYDTASHDAALPVPIGRPIANTRIYILDDAGRLVVAGLPGEICVAGNGVSRGYWNNPEATEQKFTTDRFSPASSTDDKLYRTGDLGRHLPDGTIEFLGRVDRQLKIRGYRIEPAEIEAALQKHPLVCEAMVVPVANPSDSGEDDFQIGAGEEVERLTKRLLANGSAVAEEMLTEIEELSDEQASLMTGAEYALSLDSLASGLHK